MGVRKTTDFLEKATWTLAVALLVLCLAAAITIPRGDIRPKSQIEKQVQQTPDPTQSISFPTQAPKDEQGEEE